MDCHPTHPPTYLLFHDCPRKTTGALAEPARGKGKGEDLLLHRSKCVETMAAHVMWLPARQIGTGNVVLCGS